MQIGYHMFTRGATATPESIAAVACHCEALGFDYFGVSDHVVISASINSAYPYSADGSWAGAAEGVCMEILTTLGYLACATKRIRLLTSVMVAPHRPAVLTAKMLATIDVLSHGRLTVGVGVGWMREELQALAAPDFDQRGRASGEYLEAFKVLWNDDLCHYDGDFVQFKDVVAMPKPVQDGGPPVWIGGEGVPARRRAARYGSGWYPVSQNPRHPLNTLSRFKAGLADVHQQMESYGRDPSMLQVGMFAPHLRVGEEVRENGERLAFTGSAQAIRDDINEFETAGLQVLVPNLDRPELQRILDDCSEFAEIAASQ